MYMNNVIARLGFVHLSPHLAFGLNNNISEGVPAPLNHTFFVMAFSFLGSVLWHAWGSLGVLIAFVCSSTSHWIVKTDTTTSALRLQFYHGKTWFEWNFDIFYKCKTGRHAAWDRLYLDKHTQFTHTFWRNTFSMYRVLPHSNPCKTKWSRKFFLFLI